jgi:hypothetical protein
MSQLEPKTFYAILHHVQAMWPPMPSMAHGGRGNQLLELVWNGGVGLVILTALMMAMIVLMRLRLRRREHRLERSRQRWRPLLMGCLVEAPGMLPALRQRDWFAFALMWNQLHESFQGDAVERLNQLGQQVGLAQSALARLAKRSTVRRKIMAIMTLGNLREREAWDVLQTLLASPNAALSQAAMRALIQIDVTTALPLLLPQIATRHDWSLARVAIVLKEAGAEVVGPPLAEAALAAGPAEASRLLRFMEVLHCKEAAETARLCLQNAVDEELIGVALQIMRGSYDLSLVRGFLVHPPWSARSEATSVNGGLGLLGEERHLLPLFEDPLAWVQYPVAQAMATSPVLGPTVFEATPSSTQYPGASELNRQVLVEWPPSC